MADLDVTSVTAAAVKSLQRGSVVAWLKAVKAAGRARCHDAHFRTSLFRSGAVGAVLNVVGHAHGLRASGDVVADDAAVAEAWKAFRARVSEEEDARRKALAARPAQRTFWAAGTGYGSSYLDGSEEGYDEYGYGSVDTTSVVDATVVERRRKTVELTCAALSAVVALLEPTAAPHAECHDAAAAFVAVCRGSSLLALLRAILAEGEELATEHPALFHHVVRCVRVLAVVPPLNVMLLEAVDGGHSVAHALISRVSVRSVATLRQQRRPACRRVPHSRPCVVLCCAARAHEERAGPERRRGRRGGLLRGAARVPRLHRRPLQARHCECRGGRRGGWCRRSCGRWRRHDCCGDG
jgi:hypothetical protein